MRTPPPGHLVHIGTHRLHLRCEGEGRPTVVFDAALGASSLSWTLVHPVIAKLTRACAYDRAGFGWSDSGPLPRTAGRMTDELHELLQRAGVPPPYLLVGHSFGGLVTRLFASRHHDQTAGLILIEPAHPEDWIRPSEEQRKLIARGVRLCRHGTTAARTGLARAVSGLVGIGALGPARALVAMMSRGTLRREDEGILAPVRRLPPATRAVLKEMWTQPKFFEALGSQIESICESAGEVAREAPEAYGDMPLVVVTSGGTSEQRMIADAALARRSTRGRHVTVADSGHWIELDAPQAIIDVISDTVRAIHGADHQP